MVDWYHTLSATGTFWSPGYFITTYLSIVLLSLFMGQLIVFCWSQTIPFFRNSNSTDYYQWVSLVLALQAILCYVPRLVWETITFNRVGTNLGFLLESAQAAARESGKEREQRVQFIANVMDTLLFARRDLRKPDDHSVTHGTMYTLAHGIRDLLPRKRLGTALASYYMFVKFLYLFNAIGQLLLMQHFLGARGRYQLFGLSILSDLVAGRQWNETSVFPRVGFCRVPIKLTSTPIPMVTVQCTLPVNMLNEKVYVFLWFWFVFVASLEIVSVFVWIYRLAARQSRLRLLVRYLKIADAYDEGMDPLLTRFEMTFLRLDGSFLLQMMRLNAGSLVTQEILQAMLKRYTQQEEYALAQQRKKAKPQYTATDHVDQDKAALLCSSESTDCAVTKRSEPI